MERPLAVVLLSGGMDSCVTAGLAHRTHELAALHVNYGQRTERREMRAFHEIADFYGVRHRLVVPMSHLSMIGGSSLTDTSIALPNADLRSDNIPSSYVPFRNANLLAAGVSWAEVLGAVAVYAGVVEEDSAGYPDCRRSFFDAFQDAVRLGTRPTTLMCLETPVIGMTKADIVRAGLEIGAPLRLTWSCYRREDTACGLCSSCVLRLRGFQRAGIPDPLPYETRPDYLNT